jgi:hypothetical protein
MHLQRAYTTQGLALQADLWFVVRADFVGWLTLKLAILTLLRTAELWIASNESAKSAFIHQRVQCNSSRKVV